ncbi:MAG TPA: DUF4097 family beta strand repeat-containing protein [Bryobacteraceae bacterium]|nr:DUF4097 family beta strand repeat-containing protein [Bryobacteraceae bacterium]
MSDPSRPAVVHVSLMNGGITVTGYNGKEVIVEARPRHESGRELRPDRKAEGLRRLDGRGSGLSVEEQDNEVNIGVRAMSRTVDLTIQVPYQTSLKLKCLNDGDIKVDHVSGEVDADDLNGAVKLLNISGAVVAHSLNEDVVVTLDRVTAGKSMSFSTMNGDVDVTMPADTKARVKLKSDNGEIYSDFDVHQEQNPAGGRVEETNRHDGRFRVHFDKALYGSINGGGPEMQFTTFNGKIYLRKKK